jgi:pSer/pThr/pTyr-binding forkhead associated (FHA) protein
LHPTKPPDRPFAGDALCFELADGEREHLFRVGRAKSNDVVVEDATVSREHFTLDHSGLGWSLKPNLLRHVSVAGKDIGATPVNLNDGATVGVGDVKLTFHDPGGFASRLEQACPVRRHA